MAGRKDPCSLIHRTLRRKLQRSASEGVPDEAIFHPDSFPTLNREILWLKILSRAMNLLAGRAASRLRRGRCAAMNAFYYQSGPPPVRLIILIFMWNLIVK